MNVQTDLELTLQKRQAMEAILAGASITQAATVAGVSRECCSRWMNHDPVFRKHLATAQAEEWEQSKRAVRALTHKALHVLSVAMDSRKPGIKVRAAMGVLKVSGLGRTTSGPAQHRNTVEDERDSPTAALLLGDGDDAPPQPCHQVEETPACFRLGPEMEAMRAETERIQAEIVALRAVRAGMGPDED